MKTCKVYSTEKKAEADGIIVDGRVLLPTDLREDLRPSHIEGEQCYYPPYYAVSFADGMHFDLMPFSTVCEWGEYADKDSPIYNITSFYGDDEFDEKWGYCNTKTGEIAIAPEMSYCEEFNKYGKAVVKAGLYNLIDTDGDIESGGGYVAFAKSRHGVFFFCDSADGWGAFDSEWEQLVEPLWNGIEWDGIGGFTVTRKIWGEDEKADRVTYGIKNAGDYGTDVIHGLTEKPTLYEFPAKLCDFSANKKRVVPSAGGHCDYERLRLIQRDDKYGLVRDVLPDKSDPLSTYSELVLEPEYDYDELPDAAYDARRADDDWNASEDM